MELIARPRGDEANGRGDREEMDVVGLRWQFWERSEIKRQRVPETRGGIKEGMIRKFKLGCQEWKGETEVVRWAGFTRKFDIDKIPRFLENIVSNSYDFVLYAFFDLEPVKGLSE